MATGQGIDKPRFEDVIANFEVPVVAAEGKAKTKAEQAAEAKAQKEAESKAES